MATRTPEEEVAHWKKHSRRHEDRAKRAHNALTAAITQLESVLDGLDRALDADNPNSRASS